VSSQQPIHVIVEKKRVSSGCGTTLAVVLLLGLAIEYWYLALGLALIAVAAVLLRKSQERKKARHRPGPRDPWLNEVAVALADLGLTESARNTGAQLGGAPLEGDIGLEADKFKVYVNLFADSEQARQAQLGLNAKPETRDAVSRGASAIKTIGRVVYVANGRGGVVDEFRLDEVVRLVGAVSVPPPLDIASRTPHQSAPPTSHVGPAPSSPDTLDQLRKLGQLRAAGVVTETEFETKKAELLRRV